MRLFGDNEWLAEGFLREFRDILRTRSNASLRREEVLGELAELTRRKKAYESKYLDLRHRNFGAVAEEMGMLDDLRRYADEGFPGEFAPPHEADIARSFVLRSPKAHSMGRVRDFDLRTQPTVDGRGREFLLMDENGEVAAGLRYFDQGGGSVWIRPDLRRTGLLEEIIDQLKDTSEKMVVRMLHAWTRDPSTTARGGAALQRLIKRELDNMPPSAADDPDLVRAQADEAVAATADEALNYEALVAQINKLYDELSELERVSLTNKELNAFMQRMWETFNREYIAKTGYYKVDPETGLVDWNDLRPGSAEGTFTYNQDGELIYVPPSRQMGDLAGVTLATGLSPEAHAQSFFYTLNEPLSWNAPLSVLDMHAARTLSRKQFLAWRNVTWLEFLRQMTHGALRLWKIDKVFRPATAIVATWDEWTRIFHDFGRPAYFLWMEDKLRQTQEYLIALGTPHKREGHRWLDTDRVHHKYIKRWERRKQELASAWPQQMRAMHRHFDERFGEGYGEILPGQPGHLEAAEQFTSLMLGDEGFRKALISKEAFDEWWESPNAEWIKKGSTIMPDGTVVPNSLMRDEIYQGHLQFFDRVALYGARKKGTVEATMRAWAKAVAEIEASGGKAASVSLPR